MSRRLALAVLLLLSLVVPASRSAVPAAAQADESAGLAVIRAAYDLLLVQFYRPLDPAELLTAGWEALGDEVGRQPPAPPPLPALSGDRDDAFAAFSTTYTEYVGALPARVPRMELAFAVVDGMAASTGENHTFFLPPEAYRAQLLDLGAGEPPVGLGITSASEPPRVVVRVAPDGPADRAGVRLGDVIVAVDGVDVSRASASRFTELSGGPEGMRRMLTIDRGGERLDLEVVRGAYFYPPLTARLLPDGVGYLRLESFAASGITQPDGTELLAQLDRFLDEFDAAGVRGLVLDLRGNSGGLILTAAELAGRFLPEDAVTVVNRDERGHEITGLASGRMRARQYPMSLLVDSGSASASELVASALTEHGRAVIVGERTAGVLATSLIQPLPEGAGLSVGVAQVLSGVDREEIDNQGVAVDVPARRPSAADERAGRDPGIEAAVAALAGAPVPPAFRAFSAALTDTELRAAFAPLMPALADIPLNERLTRVQPVGTRVFTHVNQWINYSGPVRDPLALQALQRRRGWLGSYAQEYGLALLTPPGINVLVDRYSSAAGAADAVRTNDFPDIQERIGTPELIGADTAAYRGVWLAQGALTLSWRRGDTVLTVTYYDTPGRERMDMVMALARLVDRAFAASLPIPPKPSEVP